MHVLNCFFGFSSPGFVRHNRYPEGPDHEVRSLVLLRIAWSYIETESMLWRISRSMRSAFPMNRIELDQKKSVCGHSAFVIVFWYRDRGPILYSAKLNGSRFTGCLVQCSSRFKLCLCFARSVTGIPRDSLRIANGIDECSPNTSSPFRPIV